jgi:hypothetical protein
MKQYEAVIKVMEDNGGYATLGFLNQNVFKIEACRWGTKTPFASIRRIVQDPRFFFKIRPGLWALNSYRNRLPIEIYPTERQSEPARAEYNHTYYQGLLVELGNLKRFGTFVPDQDKNKLYLGRSLASVKTLETIYPFGFERVVKVARTIDVAWFNERKMPASLFEVEHSTAISGSLMKFVELQDFNTNFYIVADEARRREYEAKVTMEAFRAVRQRVGFWTYDDVAELHSNTAALVARETRLGI